MGVREGGEFVRSGLVRRGGGGEFALGEGSEG